MRESLKSSRLSPAIDAANPTGDCDRALDPETLAVVVGMTALTFAAAAAGHDASQGLRRGRAR